MRRRAASWNATAAYRLGVYWQGAGDFRRAEAAYQAVLTEINGHAPTLFNLSVTQIRLGQPGRALRTMDSLAAVTDHGIPAEDKAETPEEWSAVGCSVAYNRALAWLDREESNERALVWSRNLAIRMLALRDTSLALTKAARAERKTLKRLQWSALMLHTSISVSSLAEVPAELNDGALRDHSQIAQALDDELGGTGKELDDDERRDLLRRALFQPSAAKHLEWYVRLNAGDSVRTRYNLACYVARLAKTAPHPAKAGELRQRGIEHARMALRDGRLAAWADQDPALTPLKQHDEWRGLVARAAVAATPDEAPTAIPERAEERDGSRPAETDLRAVLEQLRVLLGEVAVLLPRSPRYRPDELAARTEALSGGAFQRELTALVASLHDPLMSYARERPTTAALPLVLERCLDGDATRYVVAAVGEEYARDLAPGTEITHWNGVPIGSAVEAHTGLICATTADARSARDLAALTHWPVDLLGPPQTDVVMLRCGRKSTAAEVRLRRSRTTCVRSEGHRLSIDLLADAVRRSRAELLPRTPWSRVRRLAGIIDNRAIPGHPDYAQLRLLSFDVDDADTFVDDVADVVLHLPVEGLILDLRGNSGGRIDAAERLLQLFTPVDIEPQGLQARATDLMARVARASDDLAAWRHPIETALGGEGELTEPFELAPAHAKSCNRVGQVYHGPVALILDALTGGAADFFVAGFADHRIGAITSVDEPSPSAPQPAEVWSHSMLFDLVHGHPLDALPAAVDLRVPVRRASRTGWGDIELRHRPRTPADVVDDDRDLLADVVGSMKERPVRILRPELELKSGRRIEGHVLTRGLSRLEIRVGDDKHEVGPPLEDGKQPVKLPVKGPGPHVVELSGKTQGGGLVARRQVTLGGV